RFGEVFISKTRDEWCEIMEGTDVCFAPVLSMDEAARHPHNIARETFVDIDGVVQPAPAPKFSRTKSEIQGAPCSPGQHTDEALGSWGISESTISSLKEANVIK
ncbi:MAG: CoA transferase, partial [Sneathiellales bacterium]|nr:CoA transferase [Sneathiellales bacterium]